MACIENIPPADSEREEGEIVDECDYLSDISSEEEYLLRQRLQVLENYNNVLERKKAKRSSLEIARKHGDENVLDLSEISEGDLDDKYTHGINKRSKQPKISKTLQKQKRKRVSEPFDKFLKTKDHKKKHHRYKKKLQEKIISESSEESEDEYRNKRRKLANAVALSKDKNDSSSLKARLDKMLNGTQDLATQTTDIESLGDKQFELKPTQTTVQLELSAQLENTEQLENIEREINDVIVSKNNEINEVGKNENCINSVKNLEVFELIDLCTDDETKATVDEPKDQIIVDNLHTQSHDTVDSAVINNEFIEIEKISEVNSDDDLELLRQHALKTKSSKNIPLPPLDTNESELKTQNISEDEDSDTAELRMICLKSALLKKAIERKKRQKLKKRLSQCSTLQDDLLIELNDCSVKQDVGNNTDIESVDMDIGSDVDDKGKEPTDIVKTTDTNKEGTEENKDILTITSKSNVFTNDELDEDEDLLRARLLTSLSKNLPNLVDPNIIKGIDELSIEKPDPVSKIQSKTTVEEKRFIINLNESDSEGEHEATKNLTKMHIKLSEQIDFQQKLDVFLKSTRMQVENNKLPDVVQQPPILPKPPEKFIPKAVNHLPKSEQIEYQKLVKRMVELEKIKQVRQMTINSPNKITVPIKETLKPRNVTMEPKQNVTNSDEQIAMSRKKIAEESSKILQLKQEATKLSQKYKIVATELRNITTAITLNKKQQRAAQNRLAKIRSEHQVFLKRSYPSSIMVPNNPNSKIISNRLQKENNPIKNEHKNIQMLKSLKVSVANDLQKDAVLSNPRLSVEIDVNSNKKSIKVPGNVVADRIVDMNSHNVNYNGTEKRINENGIDLHENKDCIKEEPSKKELLSERLGPKVTDASDYMSPLQALDGATWTEDPNAVLCPFEISGNCKDVECRYLHPKIPAKQ